MSEQTDKAIIYYLNKKGYRYAEEFVKEDAAKTTSIEQTAFHINNEQDIQISNYLTSSWTGQDASQPITIYETQYVRLKKWIQNSLDIYKMELLTLLYPLFVHCFLDMMAKGWTADARRFMDHHRADFMAHHEDDMEKLSTIADAIHVKENPLAVAFRSSKYNLKLSLYSFELFITFLNENRMAQLRKLVNQYIHIIVVEGLTSTSETEGLSGVPSAKKSSSALPKVLWGTCPPHPKAEEEVWKQFKSELSTIVKPEQVQPIIAQVKKWRPEAGKDSPSRDRIPLPDIDIAVELNNLKELSKKVNISKHSLPSACCYTFHNTYESLNSLTFSHDFHYLAGGFSDSYIDLWSIRKEKLHAMKKSTELALLDVDTSTDLSVLYEEAGESSRRLIGHSGPVYQCAFSPDRRFLLSSSQDSTIRLWSLDTFSNIVCYRGHDGPVWDVTMGPLGLYFATASSDRTARLWSTEYVSPLRYFVGHLSDVEAVQFHPNSNYMATGSADRTVRLWDVQQGDCVRLFHGHKGAVLALAMSADGKYLASGDVRGDLFIWDIATGKKVHTFTGRHQRAISSLSFSAEDAVLASGSLDGIICVWDLNQPVYDGGGGGGGNGTQNNNKDLPCDPCIVCWKTKQTPVYAVHFTLRNLLLVSGPFLPHASIIT